MNDKALGKRKFTVRVLRPVFEFVDVDVHAASEAAATAAAARKAVRLPERAWSDAGLNDATGALDVVTVVDHAVAKSVAAENRASGEGARTIAEVVVEELDEALDARRYLMLSANLREVEGAIVRAAWLEEVGENLELSDLSDDWLAEIQRLQQAGARGFWHDMDGIARKAGVEPPGGGDDPRWGAFPSRPPED